jgi:hypothetical protein
MGPLPNPLSPVEAFWGEREGRDYTRGSCGFIVQSGCIHYKSSSALVLHVLNLRPTSADDRHGYSPTNTAQALASD